MTDKFIYWIPWVIAVLVAWRAAQGLRPWSRAAKVFAVSFSLVAASALALMHLKARPSLLKRQIAATDLIAQRTDLAGRHVTDGKLQAGESLLYQVGIDVDKTEGSIWTLPEVAGRCAAIRTNANATLARLKEIGNTATTQLGLSLQQREFEKAVGALENAQLDGQDEFGKTLQDFLWEVINDNLVAADTCINRISSTAIDLDPLRRVVHSERDAIKSRHKTIAQSVREIASGAGFKADLRAARRGRAMVWDFTKEEIEGAYQLLPDDLRATSRDGVLTMFCIRKRQHIEVGRYTISNQPALKERMDIAVVYWPSRECAGVTTIDGGDPAFMRKVRASPEYGSSIQIKQWIESLPEDPATAKSHAPIRSLADLRAHVEMDEARERAEMERLAAWERGEQQRKEALQRQQRQREEDALREAQERAAYNAWLAAFNTSLRGGNHAHALQLASDAQTKATPGATKAKLAQDAAVAKAAISILGRLVGTPYEKGITRGIVKRVDGPTGVVRLPFGECLVPVHELVSPENLSSVLPGSNDLPPDTAAAAGLLLWHSNKKAEAQIYFARATTGGFDPQRYVQPPPDGQQLTK